MDFEAHDDVEKAINTCKEAVIESLKQAPSFSKYEIHKLVDGE